MVQVVGGFSVNWYIGAFEMDKKDRGILKIVSQAFVILQKKDGRQFRLNVFKECTEQFDSRKSWH